MYKNIIRSFAGIAACVCCCAISTAPHLPDHLVAADQLAVTAYAPLAASLPTTTPVPLLITDTGIAEADLDAIVMSRAEIQSWITANGAVALDLARLVAAHELVHTIQYKTYGGIDSVLSSDLDSRRAYEAQADMLGAAWMAATLTNESAERRQDAMLNAMELMFVLGDPEGHEELHPSHSERRQAVRFGFIADLIVRNVLAQHDPVITSAQLTGLFISEQNLRKLVGMTTHENLLAWSLEQSRRLVHWHAGNWGLQIVGRPGIAESPDGSLYSYVIRYANLTDSAVTRDFVVQSVMFLDGIPQDGRRSELDGSNRYTVVVPPHSERAITGTLIRRVRPGWSSELIYPPDSRAMWAAK